jgi:hypothetical protein
MALQRHPGFAFVRSSRGLLAVALAAMLAVAVCGTWRAPVARASTFEIVSLAPGGAVHLATPAFLTVGKRYAFTWPGGGPPQTFVIKSKRSDGWILVEVADENIKPENYIPGEFPTRWLHAALAVSIQEMRPLPF